MKLHSARRREPAKQRLEHALEVGLSILNEIAGARYLPTLMKVLDSERP